MLLVIYYRTNTVVNFACGEEINQGTCLVDHGTCFTDQTLQEEYINKETEILNKKVIFGLSDLYKNNQKFCDEIIDFV